MVDLNRLLAAYTEARDDLLREREPAGHWVGELSTSALSTATAVSALALAERAGRPGDDGRGLDEAGRPALSVLVTGGVAWLAGHQNDDGGWGDTDKSYSNIATTMLAVAAFHLAGAAESHADPLHRAEHYIESSGGIPALRRRYGRDKTFAVPILTNCALAGRVPWREVSPLPFELACVPQRLYRFLRLRVVSYAIPALVGIGQARYFHKRPLNPLLGLVRAASVKRSLRVLQQMQPESGGYLEAVPLTSFVVMSLASTGRCDHPVTRLGTRFIVSSVRPDGSWPIDTNLATWNTTLAINALAGGGEDVTRLECLDWLLSCQHRQVHPFTGAAPDGWGWSDLSGAVPDADDTAGALLALAAWQDGDSCNEAERRRIDEAVRAGVVWLLGLQNSDGGWPTFCRGWTTLPFDRSGADLTAHVLRALGAWRDQIHSRAIPSAIQRGFAYLARAQRDDGSWVPLWFGNQNHATEENPVYGTAKVLLAYRDLERMDSVQAQRGCQWLRRAQNEDGGWGGGPVESAGGRPWHQSSVEETALAVEGLLAGEGSSSMQVVILKGIKWIQTAVQAGRHRESSAIGFYFAKLWYHERLYPLIFTVSALGRTVRHLLTSSERRPFAAHPRNAS